MSQLHFQQYKHKLTGSSVNNFKHKKQEKKLSVADKLFMAIGALFLFYLVTVSI
ncbi:TetR family transcriptional regulator [Providencia stuartii]|uniref:TetR family transcriptional regulator n=1 Tax=Providencia stuartii TaxID=588 RepID=UPI0023E095B0|nr:TetR family transcriptional regulator [Providencia stuartii]ELR5143339.1 TetR family transcriptional regulator [Providencia stuartii]WER20896.1 TetR family transcriptional regulator [Providencia stuartii]WER25016.1 TetR family transcriptional regulator [Providencia stuartii]WER29106.1 TetR family transcriptional regulator [Providencia stuartii]